MLFALLLFQVFAAFAQPPTGYYDGASGQSGEVLHTTLHNIIKDHTVRTYDQLWTDFQSTDDKPNGEVWDMYTDIPDGTPTYIFTFITDQCGNYTNEGDCYNREHSMPKSWFSDATPMYSDLFHLVPTDGKVNGMRGNYPYGEVGSASYTSSNGSKLGISDYPGYSGIVFEPIDAYKGDFARNYFYMATRYKDVIAGWYANSTEANAVLQNNNFPVFESWFLNLLGDWHLADPVSQKEIERNNAVYVIQNNRNPFIDHPEYVYDVWGVGAPAILPEPSNHVTDFSANTITLQWTDATGGTLPEAYLIKMSDSGFGSITAPTDGTEEPAATSRKNINYGLQKAIFGGVTPGTTYYFKMWGYKGSGTAIDYKTDGTVQQVSIVAP
ncbi:MAG: endonuclease [Bacteroidales bacterium]|nr:endonuclease [Bacteroidales bacterium]